MICGKTAYLVNKKEPRRIQLEKLFMNLSSKDHKKNQP